MLIEFFPYFHLRCAQNETKITYTSIFSNDGAHDFFHIVIGEQGCSLMQSFQDIIYILKNMYNTPLLFYSKYSFAFSVFFHILRIQFY